MTKIRSRWVCTQTNITLPYYVLVHCPAMNIEHMNRPLMKLKLVPSDLYARAYVSMLLRSTWRKQSQTRKYTVV